MVVVVPLVADVVDSVVVTVVAVADSVAVAVVVVSFSKSTGLHACRLRVIDDTSISIAPLSMHAATI